jgi:hypothetical protein
MISVIFRRFEFELIGRCAVRGGAPPPPPPRGRRPPGGAPCAPPPPCRLMSVTSTLKLRLFLDLSMAERQLHDHLRKTEMSCD